ncbi:uncharacterized protein METZ01_LOCUS112505 [marine metagenome]|uniref:Uncharacterized protein n=1 Tax=marine metagenome TaxID=408172 RepID=A0A381X591_9ZZZZ
MQIFHSDLLIMIVYQTSWQSTVSYSGASIITCTFTLMQVWDDAPSRISNFNAGLDSTNV